MSRPKSEKTIARECEQAIRKTRRMLKREARERVRAERAEHRRRRAVAKNCDPSKWRMESRESSSSLGAMKDAVDYRQLTFCVSCKTFKSKHVFSNDNLCDICAYSKEPSHGKA